MMNYAFSDSRVLFDPPFAGFQAQLSAGPEIAHRFVALKKIERGAERFPARRLELRVLAQNEPRIVARSGQQVAMHRQIGKVKLRHPALLGAEELAGTA